MIFDSTSTDSSLIMNQFSKLMVKLIVELLHGFLEMDSVNMIAN